MQLSRDGELVSSDETLSRIEPSAAAIEAREYLATCEAAGDFEGFSPAAHLDGYRRYFA